MIKRFIMAGLMSALWVMGTIPFAHAEEEAAQAPSVQEASPADSLQEAQPSSEPAAELQAPAEQSPTPEPAPEPVKQIPNDIVEIEIRGNQIVSTNTILSKVRSKAGEKLVQETINADLKRLYGMGFFQDIRIEVEEKANGYKLIFVVDEKPIVRNITIEGNTVFKEDKLRKSLKIIEGQILDQRAVKEGVEEIRKLYADKGYQFVDVQSQVTVGGTGKEAAVAVKVVEGEKFKIKKIEFSGNTAFEAKELRKLMKTKKEKHFLWLFGSGVFQESSFQKDLENIKLFYQQEGFLDAKVASGFDYDREKNKIVVNVQVDEGQRYTTGEIRIQGNVLFPESEIWQELEMLPGQTYSQYYLFKDVERIRSFYFSQGYMDVRIIPDIRMNRDTGKVDVYYQIQEGDLFFVEKVVVRGNTKTKDIVIRRELRIRPGERFDGEKIDKSKQRLENLGYFEEITYDTEPVSGATNRKNIIFRVKEKRTGELSFGGGVSSIDSFIGFAEISQRNFDLWNWPRFTGGGQSLSLQARVGSISQDYNLSFVEPYLFNKPISFGLDVFSIRRDSRNVDFRQQRRGARMTVSKLFRDMFRIGTGYTLEQVKLDDISDDAPITVRNFEGTNWLSRLKLFSSVDTRDNVFNPTKGRLVTLSGELVGSFLGGDQDFYTLETSWSEYWSFFKKHILEMKVHLGTSQEFGDSAEVPVFDRFYAGGLGTVRGFNYRRVGPIEAGDAIGGQTIALFSLEYTFPIPKLDAFRGAVFIDTGHVNRDSYQIGFGDFSVSVGPGLKVKTPLGPVALYYGLPIANKDVEDENGRFEFSLSRGF